MQSHDTLVGKNFKQIGSSLTFTATLVKQTNTGVTVSLNPLNHKAVSPLLVNLDVFFKTFIEII
jgi:hypothetical protein